MVGRLDVEPLVVDSHGILLIHRSAYYGSVKGSVLSSSDLVSA